MLGVGSGALRFVCARIMCVRLRACALASRVCMIVGLLLTIVCLV